MVNNCIEYIPVSLLEYNISSKLYYKELSKVVCNIIKDIHISDDTKMVDSLGKNRVTQNKSEAYTKVEVICGVITVSR